MSTRPPRYQAHRPASSPVVERAAEPAQAVVAQENGNASVRDPLGTPVPESSPAMPGRAPVSTAAPQKAPSAGRPAPTPASKADTAALFRAYRSLPLDEVLNALGARPTQRSNAWLLPNNQELEVLGTKGNQSWRNMATQVSHRGAIDLVVHVQGLRSSGQALNWLRSKFPDVKIETPVPGAGSGAVRREKQRWSKEELDALFERYKSIRLSEVFERLDAHPNQDGDSSKWKIDGIGNIITKGQRWQNVHTEVDKGYGGPSLVKHVLGFENHVEGLRWMIKEFGEEFGDELVSDELESGPKDFSPPERFPDISDRVAHYLIHDRFLPSHLVNELIRSGSVYGSHPWYEKAGRYITHVTRCVFLGPASAELRDTTPDGFKGCCDGSQTDASGFSVRPAQAAAENLVAMTEAAIDAISYRALFPGRFVMSTNGAGRFLLQYRVAREAVERGFGVRMALDADMAGDVPAQKIFNAFYLRKALSHHLKVSEAHIDEWLENGDLVIQVDHSPHHLFFNTGWAPSMEVKTARFVPTEDGQAKVWEANGESAKPSIRIDVRRELHERLKRGEMTLTVSEAGFNYVVNKLNVRRDRPINEKDWNEELKRLGSKFSLEYDELARQDFAQGVPALPPELEALRSPAVAPSTEQAPPPTRPNPPPAAPIGGGRPTPTSRPRMAGMRR